MTLDDLVRGAVQRLLKPAVRELACIVLHSPSLSMAGSCECPDCARRRHDAPLCESCDDREATEDVGPLRWCKPCVDAAGADWFASNAKSEIERLRDADEAARAAAEPYMLLLREDSLDRDLAGIVTQLGQAATRIAPAGPCMAQAPAVSGGALICSLLHGHAGGHYDDTTGASWTARGEP